MLSSRRFKATVLTALAALLIGVVAGYANHLVTDIVEGTWKSVDYEIGAGAHWWNDTDTYSHHYMDIENNSNTWVKLTYKWTHKFTYGNIVLTDQILIEEQNDSDRRPKIRAGDTYFVQGYLNTHTPGGIRPGTYEVESTTQIKFENGNGFKTASWTTARYVSNVEVPE